MAGKSDGGDAALGASARFGGGGVGWRSRTTACSCQRRNDATARRCEQVSHVLSPEWVGAAGAYEPSCDLQRAPRCGGAASLPSVRKPRSFDRSRMQFGLLSSPGRPVVGGSAALERPGRPGSGPTVQHGHWGSQIRFNDEAIRLSEARQAATRAARASKWLDVLRLIR